jgi:hypothetical protein
MAGLWNVVKGDAGQLVKRVNITLLRCELIGVALGVRTRSAAKTNIESELGRELNTEEAVDLTAIADNFETGTVQDRLVYNTKVEMILNAAELNLINETQFRNLLGIN